MNSRIDKLAENNLQTRIANLQQFITEQKTSQVAGSANLLTERVVSGASFDFAADVIYQTTTAYELTINARDNTFQRNPFVWQVFWDLAAAPVSLGFEQFTYAFPPVNGQAKQRIYFWGTDLPHDPETLDILVVIYGINVGSFSVVQII